MMKPLFASIIKELHGVSEPYKSAKIASSLAMPPLGANMAALIKEVRLCLSRNSEQNPMEPFNSPSTLATREEEYKQIFATFDEDLAGKYTSLVDLNEEEKKSLKEEGLLFGPDPILEKSLAQEEFPKGRGIFLNEGKSLCIWVNQEDCLKFISI
mmetsp:Transcript_10894/g.11026  ORF Transcript_10894/g.11026 Transcript_10894/m.11026 type:complete len:155 (+) Transcript_10894:1973-2437(+)